MSVVTPQISVITPVFNGVAYLDALICSVRSQPFKDWEHIVIDDGSTDDGATTAVLARYPHLRWWSRRNKGQYATMNEGLRHAHGDWVCFISADDLMAAQALDSVIDYARNHPAVDVIYGRTQFIHEDGQKYPVQNLIQRVPPRWYRYLNGIYHCSLYVRRSILLESELFFDEKLDFAGDYDWIVRLVQSGLQFGFVNQTFSSLRSHPDRSSVVHKQAQEQELNHLLSRHRVNHNIFRLISWFKYLRSAFLETISMLTKGQFALLNKRIQRWIKHKAIRG